MTDFLTLGGASDLQGMAANLAATFPISYRLSSDEEPQADIMLLSGEADWTEAAARRSALPHGWTIIVDPVAQDAEAIEDLAARLEQSRSLVLLSETFAGNPILQPVKEALRFPIHNYTIQSRTSGSLTQSLFEQLRIARATGLGSVEVTDVAVARGAVLLTFAGLFNGDKVELRTSVKVTSATPAQHVLDIFGPHDALKLTLFGAETARPAEAKITSADGQKLLPTIYETSHRALLRALPQSAAGTSDALRDLAADVRLIQSLSLAD